MNLIRVEHTPWNPDDPEAQDIYKIDFSFAHLELRTNRPERFAGWDLQPQFSTHSGTTWTLGNRGSTSFTIHRGSRSARSGASVRPAFTKVGQQAFVLNSGDWILDIEVTGLQ